MAQRRREMGFRLALGADAGELVRMVVRQSGRAALLGLAGGVALSLAVGRVLAAALQGVESNDPLVLGVPAVGLLAAVLLASFLPARRVTRVDPVEPLREA